MLMPKKHRTLIYEYLMKEGVVVAEKDFGLDKHPVIAVPNIHVIKALQVCSIERETRRDCSILVAEIA